MGAVLLELVRLVFEKFGLNPHLSLVTGFTLLLPEVAGRDPDAVLAEELKER